MQSSPYSGSLSRRVFRLGKTLLVLLITGLAGPLPATAAERGDPTATIVPAQPKVICRKEKVLGSHFKQRICRTQAQVAQDREDARAELREMQDYQAQTWREEEQVDMRQ